jgi:hypothetical protein
MTAGRKLQGRKNPRHKNRAVMATRLRYNWRTGSVNYRGNRQEAALTNRRINQLFALLVLTTLALAVPMNAAELVTKVKVGDPAPDFTLPDQNNKPVKLSDFKGKKNVVLAFYVLAFTGG